jgi:choline dehydrogenase-like flavoprotein
MRILKSCAYAVVAFLGCLFLGCLHGGAQVQPRATAALSENSLHAVHNALFASFLPIDELPNDPKTTALLTAARDGIWRQAGGAPAVHQLLAPFVDLRSFGSVCGVAQAIEGTGTTSFASLSASKRQQVLVLLQDCPEHAPRRLATNKMGSTPQDSVVAEDFHVWGTRDLYVVDGSIFPTSFGANPMQSIYTIAKIFADHWNEDGRAIVAGR